MDARSLNNLNTLHPKVRQDAIGAWTECQAAMPDNVQIIVVQGLRSFAEENALYAQGRTTPGEIVSWATAGESYHNYGLAFDFAMVTNGKDDNVVGPHWMKVVEIMKKHGWGWGGPVSQGGSFPDNKPDEDHFEKHFGINWRTLLQLHNEGKVEPGTDYVTF